MPTSIELSGQIGVGVTPEGVDVIAINVDPFTQYTIALPDELPEGAPAEMKSARQLLKDHLNKGIIIDPRQAPHPGSPVNL